MGGSNQVKMNQIEFTKPKLKALKKQYEKARAEEKETFIFEGHEILVSYAKYMIEYLEGAFKW
jgi:hypothetical protein